MGSSTAITHVILFIAALTIASGLLIAIKGYSDKTESVFNDKSEGYNQFIMTDIKIDVVSYNNETNITHVYVRNTGRSKMDPSDIDVYVDGARISHNLSNRSMVADTEQEHIGIWDSKELLHIEISGKLNENITHEVFVLTPNGVRTTETFSI